MNFYKNNPVVIIGGGISGLTLAHLLLKRGISVYVIEKEKAPGGLARSFSYGEFTFDIGPHRFHTDNQSISDYILDILGDDHLIISRNSLLRFKGHYFPWPIHPSWNLFKFPPRLAISILLDLFSLYKNKPTVTFKDQIINMYGKTMYRHFFEGYSSKFLGIVPEITHPDWASTGIDRAIIDNRLEIKSLGKLILSSLTVKKHPELKFIYPINGCGDFINKQVKLITKMGGKIICDCNVDKMKVNKGVVESIHAGNEIIEPSIVVWTGTIHSLLKGLNKPLPQLNYLALVCYNFMLTQGTPFPFQWSYHGAADIIFSRTSVPDNFSYQNSPGSKRGLCVEVTTRENGKVFHDPEKYIERVILDLEKEKLLKTENEIEQYSIEKFPWSYPIYHMDYKKHLAGVDQVMSEYKNIIRAGRLGRFWYNNMDHCIGAGQKLAMKISELLEK